MNGLRIPRQPQSNYFNPAHMPSNGQEHDPEALLLIWMINRPSEVKAYDQALHHLSSDDFRYEDTSIIFTITMSILEDLKAFDPEVKTPLSHNAVYPQLLERCEQGNNLPMICIIKSLVASDDQTVTSSAVVLSWIDMIVQRGCWDQMKDLSRYLLDVSSYPLNYNFTEFAAKLMATVDEVAKHSTLKCADSSKELVDACMQCLKDIRERALTNKPQRGLLTGFNKLDQMLGGLSAGKLYVLAARPSVGKTAFALNIMENIAASHAITKPILFFSLEMSCEELSLRTLSTMMQAPTSDIERFQLSQEQIQVGKARLYNLTYNSNNPDGSKNSCCILLEDSGHLSPNLLATKVRSVADSYGGVSLIVIDYMQLMLSDNTMSFGGNRNQELANISRQLKLMSKEYACPVLALSQLNRQIDNRDNQKPMLSDLRDSGAIEQDADVVMVLSKKGSGQGYDGVEDRVLNLIKNRNGQIGNINLDFRGEWVQFTESSVNSD